MRPPIVRESGSNEGVLEVVRRRDRDRLAVHAGAAAALCDERFVPEGIVHDREDQILATAERQRHGEVRIRVREVGGAVERVEVPDVRIGRRRLQVRAGRGLLGDDQVIGKCLPEVRRHQRFDFAIRLGDDVHGALVVNRLGVAPRRAEQRARLVHGSAGDALERFHRRG